MVKVNSVVSLLALSSNAFAFGRQLEHQPVEEYVTCSTRLGPSFNRHVQTHWDYKTRTVTYTERFTTTPHPTVTPTKTKTKTVTNTVQTTITEPTATDVATITTTDTSTATITDIVTVTETDTVTDTTTSTSTTTIPAPAGFTPISQEQGYVPRIKGRNANSLIERGQESIQCKNGPGGPTFWPLQYPQSVTCTKVIEPIAVKRVTYTAKACTRTARPKTSTVTATVTKTSTSTVWPADVTSTVTVSTSTVLTTSTDSTTTATTTSTTTLTTLAPVQTFAAACGEENLVSSANGGHSIGGLSTESPGYFETIGGTTSAYECCLACFNTATCQGSLYTSQKDCIVIVASDGVCHANQPLGNNYYFTGTGSMLLSTVSNGPCGLIANNG